MRKLAWLGVCVGLGLAAGIGACGGGGDPFAGDATDGTDGDGTDGGDGDGGDGPGTPDAGGGGGPDAGPRACAPTPTRVIVLGDSITACNVVGGKNGASCVSKLFADELAAAHAPGATYENYAAGGAVLNDIPGQLADIPVMPGHALLLVQIGGNDLAAYIFQSDTQAQAAFDGIAGRVDSTWATIFATAADPAKFPDGATVIVSNQYNPFDDCTASPYNLSAVKIGLLHQYNARVAGIAAAAGDQAILVDQYTPFLGHGHHAKVMSCPHYQAGAAEWMQDLIHPNAAGNRQLADVLAQAANKLYVDCTPP